MAGAIAATAKRSRFLGADEGADEFVFNQRCDLVHVDAAGGEE